MVRKRNRNNSEIQFYEPKKAANESGKSIYKKNVFFCLILVQLLTTLMQIGNMFDFLKLERK